MFSTAIVVIVMTLGGFFNLPPVFTNGPTQQPPSRFTNAPTPACNCVAANSGRR